MDLKKLSWIYFSLLLIGSACKSVQHISHTDVSYQTMKADSSVVPDESVIKIIAPYKSQLDAEMNEVIGNIEAGLTKQKPESTLGNWVADVLLESLRQSGYDVDISIVNYGGLRVPEITAGPLTKGELFELSPFDNMIMIVDVPGKSLDSIFQLVASADGWPVSKGVKLVIGNKMVKSSRIYDQPIDPVKVYKVATLDYIANGGDDMKPFILLSRKQTGKVLRDILIDYALKTKEAGIPITASLDGRIIIQN
jgi:2',3'-cyclic-nucleotide 2'-phosphodiesterase (5'-nucleotidase family)